MREFAMSVETEEALLLFYHGAMVAMGDAPGTESAVSLSCAYRLAEMGLLLKVPPETDFTNDVPPSIQASGYFKISENGVESARIILRRREEAVRARLASERIARMGRRWDLLKILLTSAVTIGLRELADRIPAFIETIKELWP